MLKSLFLLTSALVHFFNSYKIMKIISLASYLRNEIHILTIFGGILSSVFGGLSAFMYFMRSEDHGMVKAFWTILIFPNILILSSLPSQMITIYTLMIILIDLISIMKISDLLILPFLLLRSVILLSISNVLLKEKKS